MVVYVTGGWGLHRAGVQKNQMTGVRLYFNGRPNTQGSASFKSDRSIEKIKMCPQKNMAVA